MQNKNINESYKLLKIIYFDENSATDYLIMKNNGIISEIEKQLTSNNKEKGIVAQGNLWAKIPLFLMSIGGKIEGKGEFNIENKENDIIKKTITNSLLSDFIKECKKDKDILEFKDFVVNPKKNSMTFIKMFTPYLKMIDSNMDIDGNIFNFSNMDDAFEDGKGYYELIAKKENKKNIFRFNINSFRNNYTISDLTKMNLIYFGIKVGETKEENLDIINELNLDDNSYTTQLEDIEYEKSDLLDIYDIVLAGVNNGN